MLEESIYISQWTEGGFNYDNIKDLDFNDYEFIMSVIKKIQEKEPKD